MIARCTRPTSRFYPNYGGRGIRVCDKWLHDYPAFIADVGPRPSPEMMLERKDNDRNYEPGNVVWATPTEQARNKSTTHWLTVKGERKSLAEWAEITGICPRTLWQRTELGWTDERVVLTKVRKMTRGLTIDGRTQRIVDWASETGTPQKIIAARLHRGLSPRDAVYGRRDS